jgi:hypothetical protein
LPLRSDISDIEEDRFHVGLPRRGAMEVLELVLISNLASGIGQVRALPTLIGGLQSPPPCKRLTPKS